MGREEDIVKSAVTAAEGVIFSQYARSEVTDLDVTVRFDNKELEIDVYVSIPEAPNEAEVADDAALAAREVIDTEFDAR